MTQPIDLSATPEFAIELTHPEPAGPFDFRLEADRLILAARFMADVPAAELLRHIERAHTLGPIMDPTAYRDALHRGALDLVAELAQAAHHVRDVLDRLAAR